MAHEQRRTRSLRKLSDLRDRRFAGRRSVAQWATKALHDTVRVSVIQAGEPK